MRGLLALTNVQIESALNDGDLIAPPSTYALLIALRAMKRPLLVITASSKAAEELTNELLELHSDTLEFPAWETLPHERLSPRDRKSTRLNSSHVSESRMPSSA